MVFTRRGYLFLGAANERSTAHPQRDFYIHILGIYTNGKQEVQPKADEVYFFADNIEDSFHKSLRLYAGAAEMALISSEQIVTNMTEKRRNISVSCCDG